MRNIIRLPSHKDQQATGAALPVRSVVNRALRRWSLRSRRRLMWSVRPWGIVSITSYFGRRWRISGDGEPSASGPDLVSGITLLTGRSRPGSPADPRCARRSRALGWGDGTPWHPRRARHTLYDVL